eukprot:15432456-Alexandrium_andersonii.AAC.1
MGLEASQSPADRLTRLSVPEIDPAEIVNEPTMVVENAAVLQQSAGGRVSDSASQTIGGAVSAARG